MTKHLGRLHKLAGRLGWSHKLAVFYAYLHKLAAHLHIGTGEIIFGAVLTIALLVILFGGKWMFRLFSLAAIGAVAYFTGGWAGSHRMVAIDLTAAALAFVILAARRPGRGRGNRQWRPQGTKRQRAWKPS